MSDSDWGEALVRLGVCSESIASAEQAFSLEAKDDKVRKRCQGARVRSSGRR
jgi:hypothetical protein